jgi:hypothetical protein
VKKYRLFLIFIIPLFFIGYKVVPATFKQQKSWRELNVGPFRISVPQNWKYEDPGEQEDSFVGQITGPQVVLSFDCSNMGYANHLIQTEQEYLNSKDWMYVPSYLYEVGANKNSFIVKKIIKPDSKQKMAYPKADYIATINYKGYPVLLPIKLPEEIKSYFTKTDTVGKYIIKTIWPKKPEKGMTGIYVHSSLSAFNFQMNGKNLSADNQESALKAFKTIKFK